MPKMRSVFLAQATRGAVIEAQPVHNSREYTYRLSCACGWKSEVRKGVIGVVPGAALGRFDCESCGRSETLNIREDRGCRASVV